MSEPISSRTCGGCTACCKTHAVDEVQSVSGVWCRHCTIGSGCQIYDRRPESCRRYECLWLMGRGAEADRPDRLGVVMDVTVVRLDGRSVVVLNLWEVEAGAADQRRVRQITEGNLAAGNVVRHRLVVSPDRHPLRVVDRICYPDWLSRADQRTRFVEALRRDG